MPVFGPTRAAHTVAAHDPLAAVGVEHPHGRVTVGPQRGTEVDHPVRTHRKMPPRQLHRPRGGVGRQPRSAAVDVDIVVARALHFGKIQLHLPTSPQILCNVA